MSSAGHIYIGAFDYCLFILQLDASLVLICTSPGELPLSPPSFVHIIATIVAHTVPNSLEHEVKRSFLAAIAVAVRAADCDREPWMASERHKPAAAQHEAKGELDRLSTYFQAGREDTVPFASDIWTARGATVRISWPRNGRESSATRSALSGISNSDWRRSTDDSYGVSDRK